MNSKKRLLWGFSFLLVFTTLIFSHNLAYALNITPINNDDESILEDIQRIVDRSEYVLEPRYSRVKYSHSAYFYAGLDIVINMADMVQDSQFLATDNKGYHSPAIHLNRHDIVELHVTVAQDGVYNFSFDFFDPRTSILNVEFSMLVNGEFQFQEMRRFQFKSYWVNTGVVNLDRFGHEIVPTPHRVFDWNNSYLLDSSHRHSTPLGIKLNAGLNVLTIEVGEGEFLLGDLTLSAPGRVLQSYFPGPVDGSQIITLQAHEMTRRNDSSIRAGAEFNVDMYPFDNSKRVLNHVYGWSFRLPGQKVEYDFYVEQAGYFNIAFSYRQDFRVDFPVFREIHINGEIPNNQLQSFAFPFTRNVDNLFITDRYTGNYMTFFLEAGLNTIGLVVNVDPTRHVIERLEEMLVEINEFSLQINRLTGGRVDRHRTIDLDRFIPDAVGIIEGWADELEHLYLSVRPHSPDARRIGAFAQLHLAINSLRSLAEYPSRIPFRIAELSQGTSSVTAHIASTAQYLNWNPLVLDRIYITQDASALPGRVGIFARIGHNFARFFNSFTDEAYMARPSNPEHLQVWVNRPRQFVEIMQQLVDEYFTPKTGIEVEFSLMPDQNRLILANASGTSPDVAQSVHFTLPFELGIRGALVDLTTFDDFEDAIAPMPEGLLIPSMIGDGVFSIPETKNFFVLYYRKDIMNALNIPIPDTMEEVTQILPDLQRFGMNFYHHAAGMIGVKNFAGTTPLIFQNGGNLYGETILHTTIDSEEAIAGIRQLTDLFTVFNIPFEVPSFYQHFRGGSLPIGIAEIGMYNLLLNAAPELANLWNIAPMPGVLDENGKVLRHSPGGAENLIIFESSQMQVEAWEYLTWWMSEEVQIQFGQRLQTTFGPEFLWPTANLDAFAGLPWNSNHRDVIIEQSRWLMEAPRVPGSYMLERELSNAFIGIVLNGETPRRAIDQAVRRTNRETARKLEEFGFLDSNGFVIRNYYTPAVRLSVMGDE